MIGAQHVPCSVMAIIDARWDGETIGHISARFGLSYDSVRRTLRIAGFPFVSSIQVRSLPDDVRERFRRCGRRNCFPDETAAAFRRCLETERNISKGTAVVYARNVRACLNAGVSDIDDVDMIFVGHRPNTRYIYRTALRWYYAYLAKRVEQRLDGLERVVRRNQKEVRLS